MDNGGSVSAGTLTASIATAATTTGSVYSSNTGFPDSSIDADNHGPTVFATTIVFLALATVSVVLRVIARAVIVRQMRVDDYLILVAYVLSFGMCLSIVYGVHYGFGRHSKSIPYVMAIEKQKYQYAFTLLYNPAIAMTKVSILAFYLLVFKVQRHFRRFCWITMAIVILAGIVLTLTLAFRCSPISAAFNPESNRVPFDGCIGTVRIYFASAPINILTALAIIVLPIPVLTALRLPFRQKAILVVVFSLGVFDIVVGIIRIHYFQLTENQALDFDYNAAYSFMWAAIEVNVGILCASIPMSKPLISRFFPTWLGTVSLSDGHRENTQYEPTYGPGTMVRRATIGSASRRPSIGIGWLSAYGDTHGGNIGELGHVDDNGQILSPSRGRHREYPANRLEAELWEDNDIIVKTPPTLPKIAESNREHRYGSLGESGMSGSTAVARQSETDSYFEKYTKSQTPPWEKMELPDIPSEEINPLDRSNLSPAQKEMIDSPAGVSPSIPPWEKLELPGFNSEIIPGPASPSSKGKKSLVQFPRRRSRYSEKSSKRSSVASSLKSITSSPPSPKPSHPPEAKLKPAIPSIEIPSGRTTGKSTPRYPEFYEDEDVSPTDTRGSIITGPRPLIPLPKPKESISLTSPPAKTSSSNSTASGESPLGARKEPIDVGELANEKEVVQAPDVARTPVVEAPPGENLHIEDVSNKAANLSEPPSASPTRRPSPPRFKSTESSLLRDVMTREQYDRIGSIIDPATPNSGIVTPAWAREDELRDDDGETPPAVIGSSRGFRIGETPTKERKLREYFGEQNIGAFIDLTPAAPKNNPESSKK